jgi:RNA-directed DNA polymerase
MVSSQSKQGKQKTLQRGCPQKTAVNPHGPEEAQSLRVAQTTRDVHEVCHEGLMEQVVQRDNLKKALRRVEQNKGAPGIDGITVESYRMILYETWEKTKVELLNGT